MAVRKVQRRGRTMWRARVVIGGKTATAFRRRKDEAVEAEAELRQRLMTAQAGGHAQPRRKGVPTLEAFADDYLTHCDTTNRPQYARKKRRIFDTVLLPAFGPMRLDAIGVRAIDANRAERSKQVGPKWINETVGVLLHALRTAEAWEIIDKVPRVRPLRVPQPDFDYLDDDEADRLVASGNQDAGPWPVAIILALRTGLRLGELRGLRWRDVDLLAGRLVVRQAADDEGELHPPKSGRPREVPLGDEVAAALRSHRHLRVHVIDNEDGSILTVSQCRKALDRISKRAGLRAIGWHVMRHSFASALVARGATLKAVQELLGHATIGMTMRYAHLAPAPRREAVRLLDRGVRGATTGATTTGDEVKSGS